MQTVLSLQRSVGNAAVGRLLQRPESRALLRLPPLGGVSPSDITWQSVRGTAFTRGEGDRFDIDPNDVTQGVLADCYFLAAAAAVAHANPNMIRKLITPLRNGRYRVRLWRATSFLFFSTGVEAVDTVIDSRFPMRPIAADFNLPLGAMPGDFSREHGEELWVMLLERAFARLQGGYREIGSGGKMQLGLETLTGFPATTEETDDFDDDELLELIHRALRGHRPVTASTYDRFSGRKATLAVQNGTGTVHARHAYWIRDVHLGSKTIDLMNPHGGDHLIGLRVGHFKALFDDVCMLDRSVVKARQAPRARA